MHTTYRSSEASFCLAIQDHRRSQRHHKTSTTSAQVSLIFLEKMSLHHGSSRL
ncbi:hypothetical protein BJX66DRAFT_295290 [Aspergillus keveii]|uniref:Uncharacterized protein n=1 Tax=Aspergillus keveii TaxID=714993 RepID=A0ABR4GHU9_9EURO